MPAIFAKWGCQAKREGRVSFVGEEPGAPKRRKKKPDIGEVTVVAKFGGEKQKRANDAVDVVARHSRRREELVARGTMVRNNKRPRRKDRFARRFIAAPAPGAAAQNR